MSEEEHHSREVNNIVYTHDTMINRKNLLLFDCSFNENVKSIFINFESFGTNEDCNVVIRMKLMFRAENGKLIEIEEARKIEQSYLKCQVEVKDLSIFFKIKDMKEDMKFTSCCSLIITSEE
jgi:hypothetical protein